MAVLRTSLPSTYIVYCIVDTCNVDSHGALIALSGGCTSPEEMTEYLIDYVCTCGASLVAHVRLLNSRLFVEHKAGHGTVTSMQQSVEGNVHKFKGEELAWTVVW